MSKKYFSSRNIISFVYTVMILYIQCIFLVLIRYIRLEFILTRLLGVGSVISLPEFKASQNASESLSQLAGFSERNG